MVRVRITHGIGFVFAFMCLVGLAIISTSITRSNTENEGEVTRDITSRTAATTANPPAQEDMQVPHLDGEAWNNFSGIYVRSTYRISDKEIRFIYLEESRNRRGINALVNGKWSKVNSKCFNDTSCEDYLYCTMATRFGSIDISFVRHSIKEISLAAEGSEEFFNFNVKDVSMGENHVYEHTVGVCVQPVFYLADWSLVIQFFESWLAQGATKFYFYAHSYTRQASI
ncbi:hypothetical protein RB195_001482 [Necator americanus]|uniref:Glycosyltransferase family 92 protein n=1 Tax=Necator americanus TaxID=51031 RepID=A0ABR1DF53_NECAM